MSSRTVPIVGFLQAAHFSIYLMKIQSNLFDLLGVEVNTESDGMQSIENMLYSILMAPEPDTWQKYLIK